MVRQPSTSSISFDWPRDRVTILKRTTQITSLHTVIRNAETSRGDFVFYSNRIIRLVIEEALNQLPFLPKTVTTPTGQNYEGLVRNTSVTGITVMHSGEAMEHPLRDCCRNVKVGKVLIHKDGTGSGSESQIFYARVPPNIEEDSIFLLDPIVASGNTICKAVELLISRSGVREEHIRLVCLICSPNGLANIFSKFPKIRVVTTEIDLGIDQERELVPGIGRFGSRYFGTRI